jgi:hypothetical protein
LLSYFATQKICSAAHLVLFAWFFLAVVPALISATQCGEGFPPPFVEVNQATF